MLHMRTYCSFILAALLLAGPATALAQEGEPADTEETAESAEAPEEGAATDEEAEGDAMMEEDAAAEEGSAEEPPDRMPEEDAGDEPAAASASASATAETDSDEAVYKQGGLFGIGLVAGLKANAGFGSALGGVGLGFGGELEVGYILPVLDRSIEIFATGRYQYDTDDGDGTDDRLDNGDWSYELTRQQVIVSLGGLYRLDVGPEWLAPYGALGARMYLWETEVTGESGGQNYGTYTETATDFGGFAAIGADFFVGPGSILVEVQGDFGPVDGFILRETNAGGLSTLLGYRMYL